VIPPVNERTGVAAGLAQVTDDGQLPTPMHAYATAGEKAEASVNVVGGGATGVELAGTLAELRSIALASAFPDIDPGRVHIRLIEQAKDLLTPFHPSLREYARRQLEGRGVQVMLGTGIRVKSIILGRHHDSVHHASRHVPIAALVHFGYDESTS
jgi:NADH dehydrogenase FAD-containing subunit